MRSDLLDVVAALYLTKSIYHVIRRNLIWACVYNVLGIPLAMGLFLPWGVHLHPMAAGFAMAFSSVSVVSSSLTLRWWKRPLSTVMPEDLKVEEPMSSAVPSEKFGMVDRARSMLQGMRTMMGRPSAREGYTQVPLESTADNRV
jgi:Cu+-exporting ATPase